MSAAKREEVPLDKDHSDDSNISSDRRSYARWVKSPLETIIETDSTDENISDISLEFPSSDSIPKYRFLPATRMKRLRFRERLDSIKLIERMPKLWSHVSLLGGYFSAYKLPRSYIRVALTLFTITLILFVLYILIIRQTFAFAYRVSR